MFVVNPTRLQNIQRFVTNSSRRCFQDSKSVLQIACEKPLVKRDEKLSVKSALDKKNDTDFATEKDVAWRNKESAILSFEEMPGPKFLKYMSTMRHYISEFGTQLTAGFLTVGLDLKTYIQNRKSLKTLTSLFDQYGPVVRFVSPIGSDIVLTNHPEHIQKVFATEGEYPIRSALDCLEKYRLEHRAHSMGGLLNVTGDIWSRQRSVINEPLQNAIEKHLTGINEVCRTFVKMIYNKRNHRDELDRDLYMEVHKWAFDCMGLVMFSKKFTVLEAEIIYSQDDMTWLYHNLDKATDAIAKCESGLRLWRLVNTPAWHTLVKHCDNLDNLIGKQVLETEQSLSKQSSEEGPPSLITNMIRGDEKMGTEDVTTAIMDMLLVGVNTVTSTMSFLLYHIARYGKAQKKLHEEVNKIPKEFDNIQDLKRKTPYLQACIKETLRLVPPIPVLSRILPKNITLDRYNIPRGTLIIMSTQDSSLKESNFDDAQRFYPERWLSDDAKGYHAFASIPFGCGARKCIGQNIAETMMSMLAIEILRKYKLEYHYGEIRPSRSFISKPNKQLKLRFIDRL